MPPVPLTLLTGFLGSGKTTLLSRALSHASLSDAAVLINEFGEIGLDNDLLESGEETVVQMSGGCLCCTIRDDLRTMLVDLARRRDEGNIPAFRQIVLESTGLADPAPVIRTMIADAAVASRFRLSGIVTTVDAVNGETTLDRFPEAARQVAVADRIVVTKADLVRDPASTADLQALEARLRRLNPVASIASADGAPAKAAALLTPGSSGAARWTGLMEDWLDDAAAARLDAHEHDGGTDGHGGRDHASSHDVNRHGADIRAHCVVYDEPIDPMSFRSGMALLAHCCGEDLLRFKAILNIRGQSGCPTVVQGSQHVLGDPVRLPTWPSSDRRSRLILILRGMPGARAEQLLAAFNSAGHSKDTRLAPIGR